MKEKCFCNTPEAGSAGIVSFGIGGFICTAFKIGSQCIYCVQEYYSNLLQKYKLKIFKNGTHFGEHIDWEYFVHIENKHDEWNNTYPEVVDLLSALSFFSVKPQGNWEIINGGMSLNPVPWANVYYFTRKQDVLAYAKAKFANTQYEWSVRNIGEVISREEVLKIA